MCLKTRPLSRTRATVPSALALALIFALAAGCNTASNTGHSPESANSNSATANTPPPANTSSTANTSVTANTSSPDAKPAGLSPTEVVRGYYEAGMRQDIAGVKRFLSRASLHLMEDMAKREGKTLDQLFGEAAQKDAGKQPPTFSNERVKGDVAIVDIETPGQPLRRVPLIKEDGEWKLAFGEPKSGAVKR